MPTFPNRIAEVRRARGLTQRALSTFPDCPAPETIRRLERGHRLPRLATLVAIASALDVEVADLIASSTENAALAGGALENCGGRDAARPVLAA